MKKSTLFAIVVAVLCLMGCGSNNNVEEVVDTTSIALGDNVYIDANDVLHTKFGCEYVATKDGTKPIECVMPIGDVCINSWSVCSRCFNEQLYNEMKEKGKWLSGGSDAYYNDMKLHGYIKISRGTYHRYIRDYNYREVLYWYMKYDKYEWGGKKEDFLAVLTNNGGFQRGNGK